MKFSDKLLDILFPPKCVSCGELLEYGNGSALCKHCTVRFENEKNFICPICMKRHAECTCRLDNSDFDSFHVSEYSKDDGPTRNVVLKCKDKKNKKAFGLVSDEVIKLLSIHEIATDNAFITYVPRDKRRKRDTGIDQSEYTASLISEKTGIPLVKAITRKNSSEQKTLKSAQRSENAKKTYSLNEKDRESLKGKHAIIYDDVVTTGSTVKACASILMKAGCEKVTVLSFAKTYVSKNATSDKYAKTGILKGNMQNER